MVLGLVVIGPIWLALYLYGPSLRDAVFSQPRASNRTGRWVVAVAIFVVVLVYSLFASYFLASMLEIEVGSGRLNPIPSLFAATIAYYRTGPTAVDKLASSGEERFPEPFPLYDVRQQGGFRQSKSRAPSDDLPVPPKQAPILILEEELLEFSHQELAVYDETHLNALYEALRVDDPNALAAICKKICGKIGRKEYGGSPRHFLRQYYIQLHDRITSK